MRGFLFRIIFTCLMFAGLVGPGHAIVIKEVTSPGGITAWLVEGNTIPLIAMNFSFEAGTTSDPIGKEGTAHFLTGMMDEGADDMDGPTFQSRRDELAVKISFDAGLDQFEGTLQTLSKNKAEAFELLRKAVTAPHFETEAMERVRQQFLVSAKDDEQDPDKIAGRAWMKLALGDHPYARLSNGTPETIAKITPADLQDIHRRIFSRKGLKVSVVGDITAIELGKALDDIFGKLPDTDPPVQVQDAKISKGPITTVIERDIPQSIIVFGHEGLLRKDPDFFPAFVMSHILGGSGFASTLTTEVREKRGLTYGIGFGLNPLDHAGLYIGSVSTRNEKAGETLGIVKDVVKKMAEEGPDQATLDDAKTFLTGSYALRFDSNDKIAGQLLGLQQQNLGINYVNTRNGNIEAVTMEQVKAQAKRLLKADELIVTVVGKPEGLKSTASGG